MSKRKRTEAAASQPASPDSNNPYLSAAFPPTKRPLLLAISATLVVVWIGFLAYIALRS